MKRNAVITGAAGGIGKVIAETLVAEGWRVASIDCKYADRSETGPTLEFPGDISRKDDLEEFAEFVASSFPDGVDLLVNNAMSSYGGILSDCSFDDFDRALRIGVVAPYYLTKLLLPRFKPGASVINIASTRAFMSQSDTESYSAAKGGISALTHSLAASLAGRGIRVNAISP
ncbi:MAG: SDR family oxidoreductase, partial [Kiritimatiellaeota bacterium]|nr:SDR family oxidoreductase [Kiritimatiellota bacterium]